MTNYGLTLRFKAVVSKDETGKYLGLCSNVFPEKGGLNDGFYSHSNDETVNQLTVDFFWPERIKSRIEVDIYQSTGHHDANGTEVFFGDVLYCGSDDLFSVCIDEYDCIALKNISDELHIHTYPMNYFINQVVIGNIHVPKAELERRAQEVRA